MSLIAEYEGHLAGFVLARLIYAGLPMTGVGVIFLSPLILITKAAVLAPCLSKHRNNIMGRLGFNNRTELIKYAINKGLIEVPHKLKPE